MSRVLRARFDYVYQLALLSTELQDIFASAPLPPDLAPSTDSNRKPVDGDCPICFNELEENGEAIVWCRAACGQNMHKECFGMWAATRRQSGVGTRTEMTCPYCRSVWQGDDEDRIKNIKKTGQRNAEGYVNVADQLGISTERGEQPRARARLLAQLTRLRHQQLLGLGTPSWPVHLTARPMSFCMQLPAA